METMQRIAEKGELGWEYLGQRYFGPDASPAKMLKLLQPGHQVNRLAWDLVLDAEAHKYGCLMVFMPEQLASEIITGLQSRIKPEDLVELELEPHVTIRYGFGPKVSPEDFLPFVEDASPIKLTLLEPSIFHNDHDVLKLNIFSDCLGKLNAAVGELDLPGETYTEYEPHLTLAYLKKGTGWKYAGDPRLAMLLGRDVVLDTVVYSDAEKKRTTLYLSGNPSRSLAGVDLTRGGYLDGRVVRLSHEAPKISDKDLADLYDDLLDRYPPLADLLKLAPKPIRKITYQDQLFVKGENKTQGIIIEDDDWTYIEIAGRDLPLEAKLTWDKHEVDNSVSGTLRHEIGHVVRDAFLRRNKGFAKYWSGIYKKHKDDISEYASTNELELFCESFTAFTHPDYDDELPPKIHQVMEAVVGNLKLSEDLNGVSLSFCPGAYRDSSCGAGVTVLKSNIGGSTGAKLVEKDGQKFVAKQYSGNSKQVHNEIAANKLYNLLGSDSGAPKSELGVVEGKDAVLSPFIENTKPLSDLKGEDRSAAYEKLREGFVVDAVLANWDVTGLGHDNVLVDKTSGAVHRVDNGGALEFRAQGSPKGSAFGAEVKEIDTLRNANKNSDAAKVFGKITDEQITSQVRDLENRFDSEQVHAALKQSGYSEPKATALTAQLEARVGYLSQRWPVSKPVGDGGQKSSENRLQELQSKAAEVKARAAAEREKSGSVSTATKRERAEVNKKISGLKLAAPRDVREAGDELDLPLGDIAEQLDIPDGVSTQEVEQAIQDALDHVTSRGMNDENGQAYLESVLEEKGIEIPNESYLNNLVSTHNDIAGAAAERKSTLKNDDIWGYEYELGDSLVHREEHEILEGTILPKDDPFWDEWYPPNGWGCNCNARPIDWEEADAEGYDESAPEGIGSPPSGFDSDYQELLDDSGDDDSDSLAASFDGPLGVTLFHSRPKARLKLGFCPTGPGGGIDNSCGKNAGSLQDMQENKAKLEHMRDVAKEKIAAIKAGGAGSLSTYKKMRADLNKQIDIIDHQISEHLKGEVEKRPDTVPETVVLEEEPEGDVLSFNTSKDSDVWGDSQYKDWSKSLEKAERDAINDYTGAGYGVMNSILRRGRDPSPTNKAKIEAIDKALEKAPLLSQPLVTHRGLSTGANSIVSKLRAGDVFQDKGFVSTTLNKGATKAFSEGQYGAYGKLLPTRFDITVPAGGKGAYMTGGLEYRVGGHSEAEFLLPRGSKMRITSVKETSKTRIISAEVCYVC